MLRSALVVLVCVLSASVGRAEEKADLGTRVNRAIDRGAAHLVKKQGEDGSWRKDDKVHPLGRTALCGYTLLHAGYPSHHIAIRKAVQFIYGEKSYGLIPKSTYEAACMVLFFNAIGKRHAPSIRSICQWLVENFNRDEGLWGYPDGTPDLSNTQYAVLALKAGERHGFKAPAKLWKRLVDSALRLQADCGAFRYRTGSIYRASMTHAAMLVLKFAEEVLGGKAPKRDIRAAMKRGHAWLARRYDVERHPEGTGWRKAHYYYYMYGMERYAIFFGLKELDGHDWYREGAEALLARQGKNGGWGRLEETCFAILFLRRATLSIPEARDIGEGDGEEKKDPPRRPAPDKSVPCIRDWLVAGPWISTPGEDEMLNEETIDVHRVKPSVGSRAGKKKWVLHRSMTDKIEFKDSVGHRDWAAYYAACWLHSDEEREVVLWLDSDDGLRAWLNGKEILFGHHHDHCGRDWYRVPVKLSKGKNLLLLHVENLTYYCYFHGRVSDGKGKTISGVIPSVSAAKPRK